MQHNERRGTIMPGMTLRGVVWVSALILVTQRLDVRDVRAEAERSRESLLASQVVARWWTGEPYDDSRQAFFAIRGVMDELAVRIPVALKDDPTDPRKGIRMCEALELAERFRVVDAIPIMVTRLRVRPNAVWVVGGNMGKLDAYPFAYSLATIGRDSVPYIISHLRNKRDDIDAVPEEDILIFAHVLDHIYLKSLDPECIAVLELYPDAVHVRRLLHAYRQLK
jgi:hypothetical protein